MAFVYRSNKKSIFEDNSKSLGPGFYIEDESKIQTTLRKKNKFPNMSIYHQPDLNLKIPFNTTSTRSKLFIDTNNFPGPGAYDYNKTDNTKYSSFEISFPYKEKLKDVLYQGKQKKGFLTSEGRFNDASNDKYPGPGHTM